MKALDVSISKKLSSAEHFFVEINQLYHPTGQYPQDSVDLVYSFDSINTNKFTNILMKEWFYLVSVNGYMVIDYRPNDFAGFYQLEEYLWWLWKNHYEIVFHGEIDLDSIDKQDVQALLDFANEKEIYHLKNLDKKSLLPQTQSTVTEPTIPSHYLRLVVKKIKSTVIPGDEMDKWTFGIITNGKRDDWMNKLIDSIREQKIPNYEIYVCGSYYVRDEHDVHYIPFNKRDDKGWITKKKNLILKQAKYENVCIVHDRMYFEPYWYEGMKKWGNAFEHLGCKQTFEGQRAGDWVVLDRGRGTFYPQYNVGYNFVSKIDYRDHDDKVFLGGQLHIFKKSIVDNTLWNETYLWADKKPEDLDLAFRLRDAGHITRLNPHAEARTHLFRFGDLIEIVYNPYKRGNYANILSLRLLGRYVLSFLGVFKLDKLLLKLVYSDKVFYKLFKIKI